eukprot:c24396_g1_i1 orf=645-2039(+)
MFILAFEKFYVQWLEEMKRRFGQLRLALMEASLAEEEEVAVLVQACHSHYCEYMSEKIKLCREDASFVVAGMWRTALEAGFLWMGGWRPTSAVVLAYSLMGMQIESELQKLLEGIELPSMAALSARQLSMLDSLQQKLRLSEDGLSNRLAVLQMLLADQQMAKATAANPPPSESNDLSDVREAIEPKLAGLRDLLAEAEQLRGETIREMLTILKPIQAGQYALAAYEMTMAVRKLGNQREANRRSASVPGGAPTNIRELASQGDANLLRKALESGVNPSEADYDGRTPLHLAASEGHTDCISLLINKGGDVNRKDNFGITPLFEALRAGHDPAAQILVERGAKTHLEDAGIELCKAAATGDVPYLSRLVKFGVDPNASDYAQRTPLHVAAAVGNPQVTEVLVREGADVLAKDRHGFTPLDEARVSDDQTTIQLLEGEMRRRQEADGVVTPDISMQTQDDDTPNE